MITHAEIAAIIPPEAGAGVVALICDPAGGFSFERGIETGIVAPPMTVIFSRTGEKPGIDAVTVWFPGMRFAASTGAVPDIVLPSIAMVPPTGTVVIQRVPFCERRDIDTVVRAPAWISTCTELFMYPGFESVAT